MRRRDDGAPLRTAMEDAGLSIAALAEATREVDPDGRGVSRAAIGFAVAQGTSGRDRIAGRSARLIAAALRRPESSLFVDDVLTMPQKSTSTRGSKRRQKSMTEHEAMVDVVTLATLIKKSPTWIYRQIRDYPAGSDHPFPVHYAGRSPRCFYSAVVAWMDQVAAAERAIA